MLKVWEYLLEGNQNPSRRLPGNSTSVLVGGCFDLLHYGHFKFLEAAKKLGDHLIIALESDEKIIQSKKREPIHTQIQRAEILSELNFVSEIVMLPLMYRFEDYLNLVVLLQPNYLAVTEQDPQYANKQRQADSIGAELVIVNELLYKFSSSKLISEFSD